MWWGGETDWPRLLNSPYVHELPSLGFGGDYSGPDFAGMLAAAQPLPRLTSLSLGYLDVSDAQVATLGRASLPGMSSLSLSVNRITTKGVAHIVHNPQWFRLRRLYLGSNPICNTAATLLADGPPRPESLPSAFWRLSDPRYGLDPPGFLGSPAQPRVLELAANRVTDHGVRTLLELPRQRPLTVDLTNNPNLTPAFRNELQVRFGQNIEVTIGKQEQE